MTKSRFLTTTASLALIGATLINVEAFARGGDDGRHGHSDPVRMTLLERLDSDADGVLSPDEFSDRNADKAQRHFNKKDTDGDALLSLEEFSAMGNHRRRPNLHGLNAEALDLCVEEVLGYELPERPDSETAFSAADANSDGSIDLDEFLGAGSQRAEERFADIDSDADAQLTSDEIDAYQEDRHEQRDAHRTCVAEQLDEDNLLNLS